MADLQWASEGLAGRLAEVARERDESAAWARTSATLLESSMERHSALHMAAIVAIRMVLPPGIDTYN